MCYEASTVVELGCRCSLNLALRDLSHHHHLKQHPQQHHQGVLTNEADRCGESSSELNFFIRSIKCTRNCVTRLLFNVACTKT